MFKRYLLIFVFIILANAAFSVTLPTPANNQMYTEYVCEKKLAYVKKPIVSTGRILMFGKEKFVYTQDSPVTFTVSKDKDIITYSRPNARAMTFDASDKSFTAASDFQVVAFLGGEDLGEHYEITKTSFENVDHYRIVPKKIDKIKEIRATAQGDKLSTLIILFADNSTMKYTFKNTVTGVEPTYESK